MLVDENNLDTFWHYINERHLIYERRSSGLSKPWTDDPILMDWKFCNVFRHLDKTSTWMIEHVILPHLDVSPGNLLFNIFLFRAFNLIETYQLINWQHYWNESRAKELLASRASQGQKLFSSAYMIRGYEGKPKWESVLETLSKIYEHKSLLAEYIMENNSLQDTVEIIVDNKYWGWGPFTSYQVALDLTYTPILEEAEDINTWCHFGPGAVKGLQTLFPGIISKNYLRHAIWLLEESPKHLGAHVPALTLQDIEFSLCELQKYLRIQAGGRMKEKFSGRA